MKYIPYTLETINQVGYSVIDNQVNIQRDKLFVTLKKDDGNMLTAYLRRDDYKVVKIPSAPFEFPSDWTILHAVPEKDDETEHFVLTISQKRKLTHGELPIRIGESIHCKSLDGIYKVVYVNRDILIITSKPWAKQYNLGERPFPTQTIFWDEFKCKQGKPSEDKN
jgi:hypothetical protein